MRGRQPTRTDSRNLQTKELKRDKNWRMENIAAREVEKKRKPHRKRNQK